MCRDKPLDGIGPWSNHCHHGDSRGPQEKRGEEQFYDAPFAEDSATRRSPSCIRAPATPACLRPCERGRRCCMRAVTALDIPQRTVVHAQRELVAALGEAIVHFGRSGAADVRGTAGAAGSERKNDQGTDHAIVESRSRTSCAPARHAAGLLRVSSARLRIRRTSPAASSGPQAAARGNRADVAWSARARCRSVRPRPARQCKCHDNERASSLEPPDYSESDWRKYVA